MNSWDESSENTFNIEREFGWLEHDFKVSDFYEGKKKIFLSNSYSSQLLVMLIGKMCDSATFWKVVWRSVLLIWMRLFGQMNAVFLTVLPQRRLVLEYIRMLDLNGNAWALPKISWPKLLLEAHF